MSGEAERVGDVGVEEAWTRLRDDPRALLIDVRTRAEWAFVGLPDLASLGKRTVLIEWQSFPDNRIDPQFAERLEATLAEQGADKSSDLYFICRSGGRSLMAARVMAARGYGRCFNVAEGFEGPLDANRHRGAVSGWKAVGLPWIQG